MLLSTKIMLTMILWSIMSIGVSSGSNFEVFLTIETIGLLIIREFVDSFATRDIKERLNIFFYVGLFIFTIVITRKLFLLIS
jgi:hypothetical protein